MEHGFSILHDKGEFTPGICANAGTQNFYNNYYEKKRYSNNGKGKSTGNTGASVVGSVVNPSNFKMLDYEASMPFTYNIQKLAVHFTPTYAIPVNPSLIDVNTKQSGGNSSNKTGSKRSVKTENLNIPTFIWRTIMWKTKGNSI